MIKSKARCLNLDPNGGQYCVLTPDQWLIRLSTLGLDSEIESIEREMIVNCKPGRVIIPGNWACEHGVFYCAARRTLEGEEILNINIG